MADDYVMAQPERAKDVLTAEGKKIVLYDAKGQPLVRPVGFKKEVR